MTMLEYSANMLNFFILPIKKQKFAFSDDFGSVLLEVRDFYRD